MNELIKALIGTSPDNVRRFNTSSLFRASVTTLAQMLPMWIEGLGADADRYQEKYDRDVKDAMTLSAMTALTDIQIQELREGRRS